MSAFTDLMSSIFSGLQGKIPVRGTLTTPSGGETFPIAICNEIKGGPFIVNNIEELKTIPIERLLVGCKCTVNEYVEAGGTTPMTTYQLVTLPEESDLPITDVNAFWSLDKAQQADSGTVEYQYSDNYNNQKPLFLISDISKEAYQAGYATTEAYETSDTSKLIWESTYDATVHKWVRQRTGALADWGIPVSLSQDYVSGDYIDVRFNWTLTSSGTPATPSSLRADGLPNNEPSGWSNTPEVPGGIDYGVYILTYSLWKISATKDVYGNLKGNWSKPLLTSTDPNLVRYGTDYNNKNFLTEWHPFYELGDVFKASRPDANSTVWTIEKISDESGEYIDYVFKEFLIGTSTRPEEDPNAAPKTVIGYGNDGWQDAVFTPQAGYSVYVSTCRKYSNGTQATPWSIPAKYNGESTVRAIIVPTGNGDTVFRYTTSAGVKSISPSTIGLLVEVYDGSNKVNIGDISNIKWYKNNSLLLGQTINTLSIFPTDVDKSEVYSIEVTYRGQVYKDQITILDATDSVGYVISIYSSTGFTYKGISNKTFDAKIFENGVDISSAVSGTILWKLNNVVQTSNVSIDKLHVTISSVEVVGIANLTLVATISNLDYTITETLTDVIDGSSLVRYYSPVESPAPIQPTNGTLIPNSPWTTNSANAVWVVERMSTSSTWNQYYRIKGEKGIPNGGFQKTVYKVVAGDPPTTPSTPTKKLSGNLTPVGWSDTPPTSINVGETTFGAQAMFTKNPSNSNMAEDVSNWDTTGWSAPFKLTTSFVGGTGPAGTNGTNGWTPQYKLYSYTNNTILLYLFDWVGGSGTKPSVGFLTPSGLSATPTELGNIRGVQGIKGDDAATGTKLQVYGHIYGGSNVVNVLSDIIFSGYSIRFTRHQVGSYSIYFLRNSSLVTPLDPNKVIANIYVNNESYVGQNNVGVNNINIFNSPTVGVYGGIEVHYTTADDAASNDSMVSFYIYYIVGTIAKTINPAGNTDYPLL